VADRPVIRALVTCASRYGATAEIADAIAAGLRQLGIEAVRRPLDEVDRLDGYDVVVLGSAVYLGRWRAEARAFGRRLERELAARPVWLFSSGPLDRSLGEEDHRPPRDAARLMARIGARGHAWFGGVLSPEADGILEWLIIRTGRSGDLRDFDAVRGWVAGIAASVATIGEPIAAR
jgi:menaquinone-dependent protoporphyrinogen oxidase